MSTPSMAWPESERPHLAGVPAWLTAALATRAPVTGPVETLWVKAWGVTALFRADDDLVVFKDASPSLFPHAAGVYRLINRVVPRSAPALLAHEDFAGHSWSVFEYVAGPTVKQDGSLRAVVAMAEQLAYVQAEVLADGSMAGLPGYDVATLPDELDVDIADQPDEVRRDFGRLLPSFRRWASDLSAFVPRSLDHPDMNLTNAIVPAGGGMVLLDWEEAAVGCPLFSLDRLTDEDFLRGRPADEVAGAYLDALGWNGRGDLRQAYELSRRLVPLRRAVEARAYARALRRADPHTRLTGLLIAQALRRSAPARLPVTVPPGSVGRTHGSAHSAIS